MFTGLLFYVYVKIHRVRILVFDNYKRCPVPLRLYLLGFFCSRIPRRASDRGSHCPQIACRCTLQSLWRKSRAGIFRFNEPIIFCILSLSLKNRINNNNNNNHHNSYHNAHIYMYHSVTLKALQYFVARYARLNMDYETYSFLQSAM